MYRYEEDTDSIIERAERQGYLKGKTETIDIFLREFSYLASCGIGKKKSFDHLIKMAERMKGVKVVFEANERL